MDGDKDEDKQRAGQIGGAKRAEILPPDRRAEIARKAATARWGAKTPSAIHRGNFIQEFGIDIDCYVLDDPQKTAVISQRGMGESLGMSGGRAFPRFLASKAMAESLGAELREKMENPLKFQIGAAGAGQPPSVSFGFDVTLLIDICNTIISAEKAGKLTKQYARIAQQAHIIVGASAKAGIKGLVYALAGYNPTAEEVIAAFKFYVREEARDYEREFPNQLYQEWYRLYQLPEPERNKPWKFKHLTVNHVYWPLADSKGNILELTKAQRANGGQERRKRLHQFLSDIGVKALRQHLGQLLGIAQVSRDQKEYEGHVKRIFGQQYEMDLG
jgi:hypothetical protein